MPSVHSKPQQDPSVHSIGYSREAPGASGASKALVLPEASLVPQPGESALHFFFRLLLSDASTKARLAAGSVSLLVCSACNILTPYILGACIDSAYSGGGPLRGPIRGPLAVGPFGGPQGKQLAAAGALFLLGALGSACRTEQLEKAEEEMLMKLRWVCFCLIWFKV